MAARDAACRHCGHDQYADRRAGRMADRGIDRAVRRARTVLFVLLLPVMGFAGQMAVGAIALSPFFFMSALSSGATGDGPAELMGHLTGFVFGVPGLVITILFTLAMLYRRFERVRNLTRIRAARRK